MKLSEAVAALEEGKKIRRKTWLTDSYLHHDRTCIVDEDGDPLVHLPVSNDWELYEEPKPTIEHRLEKRITELEESNTYLQIKIAEWMLKELKENHHANK